MNKSIASFISRKPLAIFLVMSLLTAFPAYFALKGLTFNVVLEEMLPMGATNVQLITRFGEQFGGANTTVIELETSEDSIYTKEFLSKYQRIADQVYFHEDSIRHLNQNLSLRKTKAISGGGGRVEINAVMWPNLPESDAELAEFRRAINNQYRGFLVSDDERSAVIITEFKDTSDFEGILDFLEGLRAEAEDDTTSMQMTGRPVLLGHIYRSLDDVLLILLISLIVVGLVLYTYFRTWIGVAVPMFAAFVATTWGLGFMAATGYNLDPLLILLPAFIFAIVLSHGVQLTSRVLEQLEKKSDNFRACSRIALGILLVPSTAAILTDAAGFGVLGLTGIASIKSLAIICSVWLLTIAPALVFTTALLCLLPAPRSHKRGSKLVSKIWGSVIRLDDHALLVVGGFAALLLVSFFFASDLRIGEPKGSAVLWPDSRYNQDTDSINKRYSRLGTDVLQVYIEGDENTMLDPGVYQTIELLDRFIYEHVPEARPAQSLVPVIKLINAVLYEGDPSYELLPDTTEEVGFNLYMFRSRGEPGDFAAYTNNAWEIGNVSFFVEDHSAETIEKLRAALDQFFGQSQPDSSAATFLYSGGQIGITEAMNAEVEQSNFKIMVAIAAVIAVCIFLYYRSLTTGLILLFSLLTANSVSYAFMAINGVGLNISTLPLAALGVGIGVDYGIYMIDRIREEYARLGDVTEAIHASLSSAGSAIFVTAATMILPLLPWTLFSPLRFQAEMGMLLGLVLLMNMFGSLIFVPAAVALFRPRALLRYERQTSDEIQADETGNARRSSDDAEGSPAMELQTAGQS